jgi:hypothetical protein
LNSCRTVEEAVVSMIMEMNKLHGIRFQITKGK